MWTHMGLGRRPVDAWSCGHSQGTGGTREQPGTDPLWGPADTWTSDPSPQNGQMRHWGPLSKAPICGRLCGYRGSQGSLEIMQKKAEARWLNPM